MKPLTPGSKVKVLAGKLKGEEKLVLKKRGDRVWLKDGLAQSARKKLYPLKIHISNLRVIERKINKSSKKP